MRSDRTRYPVDRYLVDSSKKVEMANIIDDEIWNPDPALRPEDEIILRKLHDMLQSTADDLKLLSGELTKFREPGVQIKSQPTPLDEEFNEKVHIEEIVNAKFHGYKIVDESMPLSSESKPKKDFVNRILASRIQKPKAVNASVQVNSISSFKKPTSSKNLKPSQPKVVHIKEDNVVGLNENLPNDNKIGKKSLTTVCYNEFAHNYVEPKIVFPRKVLHIQSMPSINIRSELKEQKVLNLDILPDVKSSSNITSGHKNVQVINMQYEYPEVVPSIDITIRQEPQPTNYVSRKPTIRKVSKISGESSESTNNVSSEAQQQIKINKAPRLTLKTQQKVSARFDKTNKNVAGPKKVEKRTHLNLDEWKKKLNSVYGQKSITKKKLTKTNNTSPKKINSALKNPTTSKPSTLNNAEYIPYSQLTLGGVRVSDIEKEISDLPNKNDIPLSPILDRILSSRENSFHKDSPRINEQRNISNILTTSDENLLQEVLDIEKTISETFSKTFNDHAGNSETKVENESVHSVSDNSYADDFEDEKSVSAGSTGNNQKNSEKSEMNQRKTIQNNASNQEEEYIEDNQESSNHNATYIKTSNLSFKDGVDVFEFIHSVDTHDTATQSHKTSKISLKETQTSPRNDRTSVQPIHNELWPPMDPKGEVEKLFQLEKEFIKKLIVSEYGNILEENITKPSTSKAKDDEDRKNNISALQKNTQTSPAHVKCVMTSPTRTKTRTTSPFSLSLTVDRQTSPFEQVDREELKILIDKDSEDHAISINLSSPRFSLKLPQNSREVLSNLDDVSRTPNKTNEENEIAEKSRRVNIYATSSSSSVGADNSSEISSLGEIKYKLRRKIKKSKVSNVVESSSSSLVSKSSDIYSGELLPLKSEGELSFGQMAKKSRGRKDSDGELSSGAL